MPNLASPVEEQFRRGALSFYRQQQRGGGGGAFPVFRGGDYQFGSGIGNIFKSIARFLLPIFASAGARFMSSTADDLSAGKSFKESAKAAIKPSIAQGLSRSAYQLTEKFDGPQQSGSGRKRTRGRKRKATSSRSVSRARVYKGVKKARRRKSPRKKSKNSKSVRFLPTNF